MQNTVLSSYEELFQLRASLLEDQSVEQGSITMSSMVSYLNLDESVDVPKSSTEQSPSSLMQQSFEYKSNNITI